MCSHAKCAGAMRSRQHAHYSSCMAWHCTAGSKHCLRKAAAQRHDAGSRDRTLFSRSVLAAPAAGSASARHLLRRRCGRGTRRWPRAGSAQSETIQVKHVRLQRLRTGLVSSASCQERPLLAWSSHAPSSQPTCMPEQASMTVSRAALAAAPPSSARSSERITPNLPALSSVSSSTESAPCGQAKVVRQMATTQGSGAR